MEKIFEQALLYDFYGELLTPHQRCVYEDVVYNDLSLGEIAQEQGISRQGVHDLVRRCDRILRDYEKKLHLVEKFSAAREKIGEIVSLTQELEAETPEADTPATGKADLMFPEEKGTQAGGHRDNIRRIRLLAQDLMKEW